MATTIKSLSKTYERKISIDYQVWSFSTSLSADVVVNSKEELAAESDKLFKQARALVERDVAFVQSEIKPQSETEIKK